ncbi:MAG: histidine kinase [Gallicola sp.]|nr:histidine kinase [Gallicola sp.]
MELLLDSIILAILGFLGNYFLGPEYKPVMELFISLIFWAVFILFFDEEAPKKKDPYIKKAILIVMIIMSFYLPSLLVFVPMILLQVRWQRMDYFWLFPLLTFFSRGELLKLVYLMVLTILSLSLAIRQKRFRQLKDHFYQNQDESDTLFKNMKIQNQRLIENQNIEITNSTLKERNRISKEIHDNVGHLLASAILQLAALEYLVSEEIQESFSKVRTTVEEAMEKTRKSVHGLYDESLNMEVFLKETQQDFTFCDLEYIVEIEKEPQAEIHYAIASIIKESLSNVVKHSNADKVRISLTENRGNYYLLIKDNGKTLKKGDEKGLGLMSMRERVEDLRGSFYLNRENGYHIFVTIPVKES